MKVAVILPAAGLGTRMGKSTAALAGRAIVATMADSFSLLGGIVVAKRDSDLFQSIRNIQYEGGAVPSPFDCWLILRGMRTLPWRMRAHSENAMNLATFLSQNPKIRDAKDDFDDGKRRQRDKTNCAGCPSGSWAWTPIMAQSLSTGT